MPSMTARTFVTTLLILAMGATGALQAQAPVNLKVLFDPAIESTAVLGLNDKSEGDVGYKVAKDGVEVTVQPNSKSSFPGVTFTPSSPWNATGFGHVEASITNLGTKNIRANLVLYNEGNNHSNSNSIAVKPGQTAVLATVFNYNYGVGAYELKPGAIVRALIFTSKSDVEQRYRISALVASGPLGERPTFDKVVVNPAKVAYVPRDGIVFGGPVVVQAAKQILPKAGAKAGLTSDGKAISIDFSGTKDQAVVFRPLIGEWNLNAWLQVRVTLKNTGSKPLAVAAQLNGFSGKSDLVHPARPIAPGAEGEIVIPFQARIPARLEDDPAQLTLEGKKDWQGSLPGTGNTYRSNVTTDITLIPDADAGPQSFRITSIVAGLPEFKKPDWLGKRPPVPGEWTQTFNEDFNGNAINLHTWNIYSEGEWHLGAQTHYSRDNVIVKDGKLILRLSEKRGHHNDNPAFPQNDYQTGYADTFGKWTQRYGYFEARMKLPTAPNMFLAWWMMPDRGQASGKSITQRNDTKDKGMEFDIMESLSIWGVNRHDFGMHWDGYQKYHKDNGYFQNYATPDKEGFITVGMLWTPGSVIFYDNGVETGRWESSRVGSVQEEFILDLISGGWETDPLDEKQLPADFVIDYVRAWQRKDLASPEDGPKPNDGGPLFPMTPAEIKSHAPTNP